MIQAPSIASNFLSEEQHLLKVVYSMLLHSWENTSFIWIGAGKHISGKDLDRRRRRMRERRERVRD